MQCDVAFQFPFSAAFEKVLDSHKNLLVSSILTLKYMTRDSSNEDRVDHAIGQWQQTWPELATDAIGVVARILLLGRHLETHGAEALRRFDLQTGEFDVLATLRRAGEPYALTMGELCQDVMLTSGGMTHRVDRLVERQLVTREHDPADRRSVLVRLTEQGRVLTEEALLSKIEQADDIVSALSASECDTLRGLLRRLLLQFEDPATPPNQ